MIISQHYRIGFICLYVSRVGFYHQSLGIIVRFAPILPSAFGLGSRFLLCFAPQKHRCAFLIPTNSTQVLFSLVSHSLRSFGAESGIRTRAAVWPRHFKCRVSTNSTTSAYFLLLYYCAKQDVNLQYLDTMYLRYRHLATTSNISTIFQLLR